MLTTGMQVGEFMTSPFVGAGFQLSSADVLIEVPFDPKLDMLFVGEEILYSARLWTKGWDMFAPDENLVWHHYNRWVSPKTRQSTGIQWLLNMLGSMMPHLPVGVRHHLQRCRA